MKKNHAKLQYFFRLHKDFDEKIRSDVHFL